MRIQDQHKIHHTETAHVARSSKSSDSALSSKVSGVSALFFGNLELPVKELSSVQSRFDHGIPANFPKAYLG